MWPEVVEIERAGVDDVRPHDLAGADRVAQRQRHAVAVAEVAHRGEAGAQRLVRIDERVVGDARRLRAARPRAAPSCPPVSEIRCTWLSISPGSTNRVALVDRRAGCPARRRIRRAPRRCARRGSRSCSARAAPCPGDRASARHARRRCPAGDGRSGQDRPPRQSPRPPRQAGWRTGREAWSMCGARAVSTAGGRTVYCRSPRNVHAHPDHAQFRPLPRRCVAPVALLALSQRLRPVPQCASHV